MSREQFLNWVVFLNDVQAFGPEYEDVRFARLTSDVVNRIGDRTTPKDFMPQWEEIEIPQKQTPEQDWQMLMLLKQLTG